MTATIFIALCFFDGSCVEMGFHSQRPEDCEAEAEAITAFYAGLMGAPVGGWRCEYHENETPLG